MAGNLGLAWFLDRARRLLSSPESVRKLNIGSGYPADRRRPGDPLHLTTKSCGQGVTFPPKPL
jgi:hypothetical protein